MRRSQQKCEFKQSCYRKFLRPPYQHTLSKDQHPLTFPLLKNLTVARGADEAVEFSLRNDIVRPIEMLETMEIDIFANLHSTTGSFRPSKLASERTLGSEIFMVQSI